MANIEILLDYLSKDLANNKDIYDIVNAEYAELERERILQHQQKMLKEKLRISKLRENEMILSVAQARTAEAIADAIETIMSFCQSNNYSEEFLQNFSDAFKANELLTDEQIIDLVIQDILTRTINKIVAAFQYDPDFRETLQKSYVDPDELSIDFKVLIRNIFYLITKYHDETTRDTILTTGIPNIYIRNQLVKLIEENDYSSYGQCFETIMRSNIIPSSLGVPQDKYDAVLTTQATQIRIIIRLIDSIIVIDKVELEEAGPEDDTQVLKDRSKRIIDSLKQKRSLEMFDFKEMMISQCKSLEEDFDNRQLYDATEAKVKALHKELRYFHGQVRFDLTEQDLQNQDLSFDDSMVDPALPARIDPYTGMATTGVGTYYELGDADHQDPQFLNKIAAEYPGYSKYMYFSNDIQYAGKYPDVYVSNPPGASLFSDYAYVASPIMNGKYALLDDTWDWWEWWFHSEALNKGVPLKWTDIGYLSETMNEASLMSTFANLGGLNVFNFIKNGDSGVTTTPNLSLTDDGNGTFNFTTTALFALNSIVYMEGNDGHCVAKITQRAGFVTYTYTATVCSGSFAGTTIFLLAGEISLGGSAVIKNFVANVTEGNRGSSTDIFYALVRDAAYNVFCTLYTDNFEKLTCYKDIIYRATANEITALQDEINDMEANIITTPANKYLDATIDLITTRYGAISSRYATINNLLGSVSRAPGAAASGSGLYLSRYKLLNLRMHKLRGSYALTAHFFGAIESLGSSASFDDDMVAAMKETHEVFPIEKIKTYLKQFYFVTDLYIIAEFAELEALKGQNYSFFIVSDGTQQTQDQVIEAATMPTPAESNIETVPLPILQIDEADIDWPVENVTKTEEIIVGMKMQNKQFVVIKTTDQYGNPVYDKDATKNQPMFDPSNMITENAIRIRINGHYVNSRVYKTLASHNLRLVVKKY